MQYKTLLALAAVGQSAVLPVLESRQDSASSQDPLHTKVSMGDNFMDWGTALPSDAISEALNSQCPQYSALCDTNPYTYSQSTSVAFSYTPGGSNVAKTNTDNLVFNIEGVWATETQRAALVGGLRDALGTATQNNSFYSVGSEGNQYTAALPGGEFFQYNTVTFVGISIIDGDETKAYMSAAISEMNADSGWCGVQSDLFPAISAAVAGIPEVGTAAASIFGFISAACK